MYNKIIRRITLIQDKQELLIEEQLLKIEIHILEEY